MGGNMLLWVCTDTERDSKQLTGVIGGLIGGLIGGCCYLFERIHTGGESVDEDLRRPGMGFHFDGLATVLKLEFFDGSMELSLKKFESEAGMRSY
eukprot:1068030-Amorphochlora_amoeboformis.AAC.2